MMTCNLNIIGGHFFVYCLQNADQIGNFMKMATCQKHKQNTTLLINISSQTNSSVLKLGKFIYYIFLQGPWR